MAWRKPSAELIEFLAERMKGSDAQVKMMFGSPTYFINNNMIIGVHQDSLFIRLSPKTVIGWWANTMRWFEVV